jgi:hypothetical protein
MVDASLQAMTNRKPEFEQFLFRGAQVASVGMDQVELEKRSLGTVDVPDGRVYACDPLVPMDSNPLTQRLVPGQYEVILFVAVGRQHGTDTKMECNAAAALLCSRENPEHWALAAREGGPPDAAAYGVDSGTGGFMGSGAIELLVEGDDALAQVIIQALAKASGAVVTIDQGCSVAAFTSGIGDGTYDTWLGRDARGDAAIILTDFAVLNSEDYVAEAHANWAAHKAKKWWQFWK